jgi:hypothetical protein
MNTYKILVTLIAALLFSGCGKWTQDPLAEKKGDFEQAKPVPTKPDLEKPLPSSSVSVIMPDFQTFTEGEKTEFQITARVLLEGYTAQVSIENMADFPGATYDVNTKIFSWTPPAGFVTSINENGVIGQLPLIVRAYGYKPEGQVLVDEQERPIYVVRQLNDPLILSANKPATFLREGTTMRVPVIIFDKDALPNDRSTWPKLTLTTIAGAKSLSALTSIAREESLGSNRYQLTIEIDARDVELSDSIDRFKVGLFATTRFNKFSPQQEIMLEVYTSFATPVSTWTENLQAKETEALVYKFIITDPKLEAVLKMDRVLYLPTGSDLSCQATARGVLNCTFTWTPGEGQAGSYNLRVDIQSRNLNTSDSTQQIRTLDFRTQVLPKGS